MFYIFGRTIEGQKVVLKDANFSVNIFACLRPDADEKQAQSAVSEIMIDGSRVVDISFVVNKADAGEGRRCLEIRTRHHNLRQLSSLLMDTGFFSGMLEHDIPLDEKYLLENNISPLSLVEVEGEQVSAKMKVPVIRVKRYVSTNGDTIGNLKVLAFDIEAYNPKGRNTNPDAYPILMISLFSEGFRRSITWKRFDADDVEFVDSEAEMILRFKQFIDQQAPDVLVGFDSDSFDWPYIKARAEKYGLRLDFGMDYSSLDLQRGQFMIKGLTCLDVFKYIIRHFRDVLKTDSFDLDSISRELIGLGKIDADIEDLYRVWEEEPAALDRYCRYNLRDAELAFRLFGKVKEAVMEFSKICGINIFDACSFGFSQLVESYLMKQAKASGLLIPQKPSFSVSMARKAERFKGGFVKEPDPGVYHDVYVYDFRSLYPSIMLSGNVGPDTIGCACCAGKSEVWFCSNRQSFFMKSLESIVSRRMRIKDLIMRRESRGESSSEALHVREKNLKILANAFFGYLGFSSARWYSVKAAEEVARIGRKHIHDVIDELELDGFKVLYSDTDSIFASPDPSEVVARINKGLPDPMSLDLEGVFRTVLFVPLKEDAKGAKKKYVLVDKDDNLIIKGFETIRSNVSPFIRDVQKDILGALLIRDDLEGALGLLRDAIGRIKDKAVDIDQMVLSTKVTRELDKYETIAPHVAVAQKLKDRGYSIKPGMMISYVIMGKEGLIRERAVPIEDAQDYDDEYYIDNQLIPSVERIFEVFGISREKLLENLDQKDLGGFL